MSFSSGQWTIPELCVWITTRSKSALNSLPSSVKRSLRNADMIYPGAYSARDEVIEAAQAGDIIVTCAGVPDRHNLNPGRREIPAVFWKDAEIKDSTAGWMADFAPRLVAERVDQPGKQYDELLVDSAAAKILWGPNQASNARKPVYEEAVTYSSGLVPVQFTDWVREQGDAIITADMAEDAMRGAKDGHGHRPGGLLTQGLGLSRETIREWVKKVVPSHQQAAQGISPSRTKRAKAP
jgi:hypothetical protein